MDDRGTTVRGADDRIGPSSLRVHLLAGLPTEAVRRGFEQARDEMPVVAMTALADFTVGDASDVGVLLPPFVEPSLAVESWVDGEFLQDRFGRPAHIEGIETFVDVDHLEAHLASADPLAQRGWGQHGFDRRTVADVLVGQIEAATRLVLVGVTPVSASLRRVLALLNPSARRIPPLDRSPDERSPVAAAMRAAPSPQALPIVPSWLRVLQGEWVPEPGSGFVTYRRTRPFDANRLATWLADPPAELVRGKGNVWVASEPDQSFGYSCAGSVHRLYPAGRWWASRDDGAWPSCDTHRRRLLARWHPRFGDRRQELVFAGVGFDPEELCAGLDACLSTDEAMIDLSVTQGAAPESPGTPPARLH